MSKAWLITGSSRGLGRAFTVAALEAGHRVVAGARKPEQLADLENRFGKNILTISLDVTNEEQAKRAVEMALETFGALDVLVNNAGYGNVSPVEDTSVEEFRKQIETNLFGVIIMTKAVLPYFREQDADILSRCHRSAAVLVPSDGRPTPRQSLESKAFQSRSRKRLDPLASRSPSSNLAVSAPISQARQQNSVKADLSMSPL